MSPEDESEIAAKEEETEEVKEEEEKAGTIEESENAKENDVEEHEEDKESSASGVSDDVCCTCREKYNPEGDKFARCTGIVKALLQKCSFSSTSLRSFLALGLLGSH